jgi:hypothetical protein
VRFAAALCLAACFIAAGCVEPNAPTLEELWRAPGEDVAIVPGTADFGPGDVRFTFLVIDGQGRVVTRPTAKLWLARGLKSRPFARTTAASESIGVGKSEPGEPTEVFVAHLQL